MIAKSCRTCEYWEEGILRALERPIDAPPRWARPGIIEPNDIAVVREGTCRGLRLDGKPMAPDLPRWPHTRDTDLCPNHYRDPWAKDGHQ